MSKRCKKEMVDQGLSQVELSRRIPMPRTLLNQILNERVNATDSEKDGIAKALGKKKEELFSN